MPPENHETIEALEHLGLSWKEAELYQLLVSLGHATVGKLSAFTKMSRTKIYSTLENLQAEGWIKVVSEKPITYAPVEPKGLLERRRTDVLGYLKIARDKLTSLYERSRGGFSETVTYHGLSVLQKTEEMISGAEREVNAVTAFLPWEAMGMMGPLLDEIIMERGVEVKIVVSRELKDQPELKKLKGRLKIASGVLPKAGMIIVDDEVMFGAAEKGKASKIRGDLFAIWTANPELVAFTRILFRHLWNE